MNKLSVGFIGFGEVNTPREVIEQKSKAAMDSLISYGLDIIDGGVVRDDENALEAADAVFKLKGRNLDVLILCIAGWIPSYTVIRIADQFKAIPMVLWGLSGSYTDGSLLTTADQAGTSALRKPMSDLGFNFRYVHDTTDGINGIDGILEYLNIIQAQKMLLTTKIAMMGYRDMNLYGTMFDGVSLKEKTGVEIEFIEMLEMVQNAETSSSAEIDFFLEKIKNEWEFTKPAQNEALVTGIKYFLALRDVIKKKGYSAISLIDVDGMKRLLNFPPSLIFMLLANELNICTIPENDALGSVTQIISKSLTGQISMYLEFYEFMKDRVLMGVPDFVPMEVTDGPYTVMPTNFGLLGECILNVSKLKTGTVTMCRLFKSKNGYGMHLALGEAVAPRKWEEVGWTPPSPQLPSLEIILANRTESFIQNVMSQHYIIIYGNHINLFKSYCKHCGIDIIED